MIAPSSYPLEPSDAEMRAMIEVAGTYIREHITGLPDAPSWDVDDVAPLLERLSEATPETGRAFEEILPLVAEAVAKSFNTAGPGYLAFIPGGGLFAAALADFVAAATNRYVGLWFPSPGLVQIEWNVVRWLCDLFGYPAEARGVLTSGGSMSNLSAIVTARHALLGEDIARGTIYVSEHTHHSVAKSAAIAGIGAANVRVVPTTSALRMDVGELQRLIKEDRRDGRQPFCVVASLGTTNTGAIDPIGDLVALGEEEGLWVHADAAYGGFFQLTERGRRAFAGVERAHSITLDPHKGMFLPYGTGALIVRDGQMLRAAHSAGGDTSYLQDLAAEQDLPNFSEYSPELSRDWRGLRVWLPLQMHGVQAFRDALDEKLDLTTVVYDALRWTPGFEIPWEPELSVVAFRYRPRHGDPDAFNRRLLERINASRRIFLSSTIVDGRFTLRVCIVSHRTHRDRIDEAVAIIRRAAADLDA